MAHALASQPAEPAARSCLELAPATLATLRQCGARCRCIPSKSAAFAAGLRELLAPTSMLANRTADWCGCTGPLHSHAPRAAAPRARGCSPMHLAAATPCT